MKSLFIGLLLLPLAASLHAQQKPNIILIFIDDMGWADFSSFGNKDAQTTHIDRIAAEGISFEKFYVNSPICSPSRVAISTGQYPQRWSITSYLSNRDHNTKRGMAQWLSPKAPMLARSLQQSGYATGHFGKWHMGGQRNVTDAPPITKYGFDTSLTNFEGMGPKLLPLTMKPDGTVGKIWGDATILGGPVTWMQRSQITGGFVDAAIQFIKQAEHNHRPFYINLWPDDVHSPFWPPANQYAAAAKKGKRGLYLSVLEEMDRQLGKLFDYVQQNKNLRNNTLIIICSDNGPEKGAGRATPFKGYKTHLFEGGIRSPLIVWGPGIIPQHATGKKNKKSVFSAIDLPPSLITLAGAKQPTKTPIDGENMLGTLIGKSDASRQAPIYFSRPPDRKAYYGFKNLPDLAMRYGKWKFLCNYDGSNPQLYNLQIDPGETNNIASQEKEITKKLTAMVITWYQNVIPAP